MCPHRYSGNREFVGFNPGINHQYIAELQKLVILLSRNARTRDALIRFAPHIRDWFRQAV